MADEPVPGAADAPAPDANNPGGAPASGDKPAADQKPAGDKPLEGAKLEGGDSNKPGDKPGDAKTPNKDSKPAVPDKYEFKLPEGATLDQELHDEFSAILKENGIPQEKAQAFVDIGAKVVGKVTQAIAVEIEAQRAKDGEAFAADARLGGKNLEASLNQLTRILGKSDGSVKGLQIPGVDNAKLKALLYEKGIDQNPMILSLFHFFGGFVGEDGTFVGKPVASGEKTLEEKMYGRNS